MWLSQPLLLKESGTSRDFYILTFIAALYTTVKIRKQLMLIVEWMNKENMRYILIICEMGYYLSSIKRRKSCHLWQHGWTEKALR
jgi:hypothetical protein